MVEYRAVPTGDFYYLVADEYPHHEDEIIISEEVYLHLLKENQLGNGVVRARVTDGVLELFISDELPLNETYVWSIVDGVFVVDDTKVKAYYTKLINSELDRTETKITQLNRLISLNKALAEHRAKLEELEIYSTELILLSFTHNRNDTMPECPEWFRL